MKALRRNGLKQGKPLAPMPSKVGKMQARQDARDAKRLQLNGAITTATERRWVGCGDLIDKELRKSPFFKLLPDTQRFAFSYVVNSDTDCWDWVASGKNNGYGQIRFGRRNCHAHRVSYELNVGQVPDGLTLDHLCRNKGCVNPDHLDPVTGSENTRRWAATVTHCVNGHEYTPANTIIRGGRRACRECHRESDRLRGTKLQIGRLMAGRRARLTLTDSDIAEMRRLRASGVRVIDIAPLFGVSAKYASAVISGRRTRKQTHTGPSRSALRILAIRSDGICEFSGCGRPSAQTHHRRPRQIGGSKDPQTNLPCNLLRLCGDHHTWIESNRTDSYRLGLLVPAGHDLALVPALTRHAPDPVFLHSNGLWGSRPESTSERAA